MATFRYEEEAFSGQRSAVSLNPGPGAGLADCWKLAAESLPKLVTARAPDAIYTEK
jgi:hypothetical protein